MQNSNQIKKLQYKIQGMHCASCEVLVERKFKEIPGVQKVKVSHVSGRAKIYCTQEPQLHELENAIKNDGYGVVLWQDRNSEEFEEQKNSKKDYYQIGAIFLILFGIYLLFKQFDFLPRLGLTDNMSYGFVFVIGLVAAMSTCLAVTGGLLLAISAKYNERFKGLTGFEKFKPTMYFNAGRLASYTVFGGAIGAIGSALTISPRFTGLLTIAASAVMIILGFQLLKLFPWMRRLQPKSVKFLAHKIHDLSGKNGKSAPLLLGASTFFLPCGFTQALQLYVLSQGGITRGALTMFVFSLGTLPALLSLSFVSSFAKGSFQGYFIKFAGALVVLLGIFNIGSGLNLTGISSAFSQETASAQSQDPNVIMQDGKQIVNMFVNGIDYAPMQFTIVKDIPVEWRIDGKKAVGCTQVIIVPQLGITQYLSSNDITVVRFTPKQTGEIRFSCSMGMTDPRAKFIVVDTNNNSEKQSTCNPEIANCYKI